MAGANDLTLSFTQYLHDTLSQISNRTRVCFLYEQVTRFSMLESERHKIDGFIQIHKKAGHVRVSNGNRCLCHNLVNEKRNNRASAAHNITVASTGKDCATTLESFLRPGLYHLLADRLGHTHGIDRICRLVGGQEYHT